MTLQEVIRALEECSHGGQSTRSVCRVCANAVVMQAVREAVAEEREACAVTAEGLEVPSYGGCSKVQEDIVKAIRARGACK